MLTSELKKLANAPAPISGCPNCNRMAAMLKSMARELLEGRTISGAKVTKLHGYLVLQPEYQVLRDPAIPKRLGSSSGDLTLEDLLPEACSESLVDCGEMAESRGPTGTFRIMMSFRPD